MPNHFKKLIRENQVSTLKQSLISALNYHYSNFIKLEEKAEPYSVKDRMGIVNFAERMKANGTIKFEVQAYVNHLKRLKHFINSFKKKGLIDFPSGKETSEVWRDIMEREGIINLLANKWASHRSVDYPHKEDVKYPFFCNNFLHITG